MTPISKFFIFLFILTLAIMAVETIVNRYRIKGLIRNEKAKPQPRYWTKEEINFLKNNINKISVKSIAVCLNRSIFSVYDEIHRLGLHLIKKGRGQQSNKKA